MGLRGCVVVVAGLMAVASPARADVHMTIVDGHVTLSAKDATVRQILAEWARVGQTRIVNAERVSGGPITLELTNVPEAQALDIVLRAVSGYLAAPRTKPEPTTSIYDRIFLLATSSAASGRPVPTAPPPSRPFSAPPVFTQPGTSDPDDQAVETQMPAPPIPAPNGFRQPGVQAFPVPAGPSGQQDPPPTAPGVTPPSTFGAPSSPGAPVGVTTPGMVVPAPQQNGPSTSPGSPVTAADRR